MTSTPSFEGYESDVLSPNAWRYTRVGQGDDVICWRCYRSGLNGHPLPKIYGGYTDDARRAMVSRWKLGSVIRECIIGGMGK